MLRATKKSKRTAEETVTRNKLNVKSAAASRINIKSTSSRQRAPRIHGICLAAATLGVSRVHLWKVLTGRRTSERLKARYDALVKG